MRSHDATAWTSRLGRTSLYLLMALPFGIAIFTVLAAGLATGFATAVIFWGIPILVLTAAVWRWFGLLERGLASRLLDASFRQLPQPAASLGWWDKLKWYASDSYTWTSLLYAMIKFPVSVGIFILLSIAVATPVAFISAPLWAVNDEVQLAGWQIDSLAESLLAVPVGFLMIPISIALIIGMGWFSRVLAELLLGGSQRNTRASGQMQLRSYPDSGDARLVDA